MDTNGKGIQYYREIDLIDIFCNWAMHWRSLLVFLFAGCIIGIGMQSMSGRTTELVNEVTATALTESEREEVDRLVELHDQYDRLLERINEPGITVTDESKALARMALSNQKLGTTLKDFSYSQKKEYFRRIGKEWEDDNLTEKSESSESGSTVMYVIAAFFSHFAIFSCIYLFGNKLRLSDDLSRLMECQIFSNMINSKADDKCNVFDRLIRRIRVRNFKQADNDEIRSINAITIVDKLKLERAKTLALIYGECMEEARDVESRIKEMTDLFEIKCLQSPASRLDDAKSLSGIEEAVVFAKVNHSNIRDLLAEKQFLTNKGVKLIGVMVYFGK